MNLDRPEARHQRGVHGRARRRRCTGPRALRRPGVRDPGRWRGRRARRCCSTGSASCRRSWRRRATGSGTATLEEALAAALDRPEVRPATRRRRGRRRARRAAGRARAVAAGPRRRGVRGRGPARRTGAHGRRRRLPLRPRLPGARTPPTRRCVPRSTSTRSTCGPSPRRAAVRDADGLHAYGDPRRRPALRPGWRSIGWSRSATRRPWPRWTARILAAGPRRVVAHGGRSAAADLAAAGVRGPGGRPRAAAVPVRGARGGASSRRPRRSSGWCWRAFAIGTIAVPAAGMGAIPAQLAAGLPDGVLRLGQRRRGGPRREPCGWTATSSPHGAVVVATDPVTAVVAAPRRGRAPDVRADHALLRGARPARARARRCTSTARAARWPTPWC